MVAEADVELGWSTRSVPLQTHACFYYSDDASLKRTLNFLRVGLDRPDDLLVVFADESRHAGLLEWLREDRADAVNAALASRKLVFIGGAPTRDELLGNIAAELDAGLERGHRLVRFLGFIAWGQPGWPSEDELLQFEADVNAAIRAYPAVIVCTYGVPALTGKQLIAGGLGTHPTVFLDDAVLEDSPLFAQRVAKASKPRA